MINKIKEMLDMQDKLNCRLDPNWRNRRDFDWYRAAWIECAEAMDKVGWKWWKKQTPDLHQLRLELVDIWHFLMSQSIISSVDPGYILHCFGYEPGYGENNKLETLEGIALALLEAEIGDAMIGFVSIMKQCDMTAEMLYEQYAAKYALNEFRWDHGYNDGSYRKTWSDGREDNEHLSEIIAMLAGEFDFSKRVYAELDHRYQAA